MWNDELDCVRFKHHGFLSTSMSERSVKAARWQNSPATTRVVTKQQLGSWALFAGGDRGAEVRATWWSLTLHTDKL